MNQAISLLFPCENFLKKVVGKVLAQKLISGIDIPGYATIIVLILLLGSMQLFCIGIIGEYVGKTFEQSKDRPVYIPREVLSYDETTTE